MLDILTIVHSFADTQTASRIRRTCRRLAAIIPQPTLYSNPDRYTVYEYRVGGKLHRLDGPSWESMSGWKYWHRGDIEHREYHPQTITTTGRHYVVDGHAHREVGPSIIYASTRHWCMRGLLHRKAGPAVICEPFANWCTMNKPHRLDAPACYSQYFIMGRLHRISDPIINRWYVNDIIIRE